MKLFNLLSTSNEFCCALYFKIHFRIFYIPHTWQFQYYSLFYVKANLQLKRVTDVHIICTRILEIPRFRIVHQLNKALGGPRAGLDVFGEEKALLAGKESFCSPKISRLALGPIRFLSNGYMCSSVGAHRPVRVHNSPPSSADVKNRCSYVHFHIPYAFRASARTTSLCTFIPDDEELIQ